MIATYLVVSCLIFLAVVADEVVRVVAFEIRLNRIMRDLRQKLETHK